MNLNNNTFENSPATAEPLTTVAPVRLLTTSAAAIYLDTTSSKLAGLRRVAAGPDWVQLGRLIRYIQDDLDWWLEQGGEKGN